MIHSASGAPYLPVQSLDLYVLPESGGGSTSTALRIRVDITSLCLPFTKSQVMRIKIPSEASSALPSSAILKLYDRRYIDDREKDHWSLAREGAVRSAWRERRWGEFPLDPLDEPEEEEEPPEGYTDDDGVFHYTGPTIDYRDEAEKEEEYRKIVISWFRTERESYRRLSDLQGTVIPKCYTAVQVVPSSSDSQVPQSFVYGLILEDVGGVDLTEIDASTSDYTSLGHSLMAAVYTFPAYGVLHSDIRSHNILISPPHLPGSPHRIVIIDFGHATLRNQTVTEEEWKAKVEDKDEVEALRWILHTRHIRDHSPFDLRWPNELQPYEPPNRKHVIRGNSMLCRSSVSQPWRLRWYDPGPGGGDGEAQDFENPLPKWTLKEEVVDWLDSRKLPPHGFLLPRPGSLESHTPHIDFPLLSL